MSQRFHVAIIGGGTGGLCLAQAVHRAGVSVAVYERSRTRTERLQGYRVHINPHGSAALHECLPPHLWQAFIDTTGTSGATFGFLTEQLKQLLFLDEETIAGGNSEPNRAHHSVSRITLHQVLSSGLDGVLHYDKEFERYERNPDGTVTCLFADGTTATADLVVGADGANSRLRKQLLPHAGRVDTGIRNIAGKLPLTDATRAWLPALLQQGPSTIVGPTGRGMFVAPHEFADTPATPNGIGGNDETAEHDAILFDNTTSYLMWSYAATESRFPTNLSSLDGAALRDLIAHLIADWHPDLRRMVTESPPESVTLIPIHTSVPVDPWPTTNITLLGDAIHSMTPFRGIGANTALRDGRLLARNLVAASRGERDLLEAIADYERQMIEYGFAAVRTSLRSAHQFVSDNPIGRTMFKTVLRFFSAVPPLKRCAFSDHGTG
ncbi:MAG TPA: NAD(P)/FAD-dependent oxidoreductase [Actinophytocola sp.]|uniref:FAD-dependent oxidoreductase n=1 Tax=Actinophytocola sp. TaxID=1872138 RepID=UPI002DDC9FE2|nr:NAD(P)/FAD-dependent oxidoreductase [Actinophytocola sp.]HEV2779600.1 NAD(P)/FAD-dependent oxidoreductase [Actinophytocola sp.]